MQGEAKLSLPLPVPHPASAFQGMSGAGIQSRVLRPQPSPENAARERSRVRNLRQAFRSLQAALPSVPPDTKLSKLDVLVLATNYIAHLSQTLDQGGGMTEHMGTCKAGGYLHPVKVSHSVLSYPLFGSYRSPGSIAHKPLHSS